MRVRLLNERQLKTFIEARDAGSFSRAAQSNYISVPALIQQIDLLEESIGFELFTRTKKGIALTKGGEKFYAAAKKILDIYEEAVRTGIRENGNTIHFPINSTSSPDFYVNAMREYTKAHPDVEMVPVMVSMNDHFNALRKYDIDFSVIAEPDASVLRGLAYHPLCEEKFSFAMSSRNPLAKKKLLRADDLEGKTVICGRYDYLRWPFEKILRNCGAKLVKLPHEYDVSAKAGVMLTDELIVIHSHWSKSYTDLLTVVPSDIAAGCVALVFRKGYAESIAPFEKVLKESVEK